MGNRDKYISDLAFTWLRWNRFVSGEISNREIKSLQMKWCSATDSEREEAIMIASRLPLLQHIKGTNANTGTGTSVKANSNGGTVVRKGNGLSRRTNNGTVHIRKRVANRRSR